MRLFDFLGPNENEANAFLRKFLPDDLSNMNMLDLASGAGSHLQIFLDKNISKITVLDNSNHSLDCLKNKYDYALDKIEIINDNILTRNHARKYDLVYLGDNSIQMFNSFHAQYQVVTFIANSLNAIGTGIINFTPVTEQNILNFGYDYKVIDDGDYLYGKIKIDIFEQMLIYFFKKDEITKTIRNRILLKREFESMVDTAGMYVLKVEKKLCSSGNYTYFYYCKLK